MNSRRIVFIDNSQFIGGAQQSLLLLLSHLDKSKVNPLLICPDGDLSGRAKALGVNVHNITFHDLYRTYNPKKLLNIFLAMLVARQQISIISHDFGGEAYYANGVKSALFAPSKGKLICHLRDLKVFSPACYLLKRRINITIATSEAVQQWARDNLSIDSVVVTNPLADYFISLPSGLSHSCVNNCSGSIQLLMVANLYPWKQHLRSFEVAAKLREKYPELKLMVAASDYINERDSSYISTLRDAINHYNNEFPELINFINVPAEIMPQIYCKSRILLHPVDNEPFGRCIVEAMACGLPVVAVKSSGPAEIMRDGGGILRDEYNLKGFCCAVDKIISGKYKYVAPTQKVLKKYSASAHAEKIADLIDRCLV